MTKEIDRWVSLTILPEWQGESFQDGRTFHLSDHSLNISRERERERERERDTHLLSAYQSDGDTLRHNVESSAKKKRFPRALERSYIIYIYTYIYEEQDWAPAFTERGKNRVTIMEHNDWVSGGSRKCRNEGSLLFHRQWAWKAKQRMLNCVECPRKWSKSLVWIKDLQPLLREEQYHVVTRTESKLMLRDQTVWKWKGNLRSNGRFHGFACNCKRAHWS